MSASLPVFDTVIEQLLAWLMPRTALDLGAGEGLYGRLLQRAAPACVSTGVTSDPAQAERLAAQAVYGQIELGDAATWCQRHPAQGFDLVILADCLGPMPKSAGLDLLNALVPRAGWLLLVLPEFLATDEAAGGSAPPRLSTWSERDLHWHDRWAWDNCRATTLALMRGWRAAALDLDTLVQRVNDSALPILDFDGSTPVRPLRLRRVQALRDVEYRPR